jgi:glycosyltransferase
MKISIITVTYNSASTIRDTLESVASQTYPNIEHIIIDGLSNDNTLEIIKEYPHVARVISEKDKGIYDAMNKGVGVATGEVIGILNSDDIFASDMTIQDIINILKNSAIKAVYGNIEYFKGDNYEKVTRLWKTKSYYHTFFEDGEVPPHPSLFVRKVVYDSIGMYYPNFKIASDYEFMLRMLKVHNYKSFFLDKVIVKMRVGGVSTSGIKSYIQSTKELRKVWEMNGYRYPLRLYFIRPLKKIRQLLLR